MGGKKVTSEQSDCPILVVLGNNDNTDFVIAILSRIIKSARFFRFYILDRTRNKWINGIYQIPISSISLRRASAHNNIHCATFDRISPFAWTKKFVSSLVCRRYTVNAISSNQRQMVPAGSTERVFLAQQPRYGPRERKTD